MRARIYVERSSRLPVFRAYCINGCVKGLPWFLAHYPTIAEASDAGREHLLDCHWDEVLADMQEGINRAVRNLYSYNGRVTTHEKEPDHGNYRNDNCAH